MLFLLKQYIECIFSTKISKPNKTLILLKFNASFYYKYSEGSRLKESKQPEKKLKKIKEIFPKPLSLEMFYRKVLMGSDLDFYKFSAKRLESDKVSATE